MSFWLRQELTIFVRLFGSSWSRALNLHLSGEDLQNALLASSLSSLSILRRTDLQPKNAQNIYFVLNYLTALRTTWGAWIIDVIISQCDKHGKC